jgi:hypothetical protein
MVKAMDTLHRVEFPLYKLGKFVSIDKNPVGPVYITTVRGKYILDDTSLSGDLGRRRLHIIGDKYPLRGTIFTLRELFKFPSGTYFIDKNGHIFKYKKGKARYLVESKKIYKKELRPEGMVCYITDLPNPIRLGVTLEAQLKDYASIMSTNYGPILYDLTQEYHEPYRRSI